MIKLKWWFHHQMIRALEQLLSYHRKAVKEIVVKGGSFNFQEGTITGRELDDEQPAVHVVPTYYEYDADGETNGDVNKEYRLGD